MGPLTNSHARARMRCAQDRSSPRLLDASSAERNVVDASLLTSFWLMSRTRSVWSCAMVRAGTRARRAHRRLRRNEARLVPARETSGREVRFLSTNGRGGADRARPSPFLCQTVARTRRVLVKWKILEGNSAASAKKMHGIKPGTLDPSRKIQGDKPRALLRAELAEMAEGGLVTDASGAEDVIEAGAQRSPGASPRYRAACRQWRIIKPVN